jgi:hypothetical protein
MHDSLPLLDGWANFYVIVGSSAAGLTGLSFVVIALISDAQVVRMSTPRMYRGRATYRPVLEDWIWNATLPLLCYLALLVAGVLALHRPATALYIVGAAALTLLFVGVHNAWDLAVWMTVEGPAARAKREADDAAKSGAKAEHKDHKDHKERAGR